MQTTTFIYTRYTDTLFAPVTLTLTRWPWYDLDLHILKMYMQSKGQGFQKLESMTDRQTDRRDWKHYDAALGGHNSAELVVNDWQVERMALLWSVRVDVWRQRQLIQRQAHVPRWCHYITLRQVPSGHVA